MYHQLALLNNPSYQIPYSAMFDAVAGTYYYRSMTGPGTADTSIYIKTFSFWFKRTALGNQIIYCHNPGTTANMWYIGFSTTDKLVLYQSLSSVQQTNIQTNREFRDTSEWYHLVVSVDVTQAAAADRFRIYVNGVEETSFSSNIRAAQNVTQLSYVHPTAGTYNLVIGTYYNATADYEGLLAENHIIDGQALDATDFGRLNPITGHWEPIKYTGTYGVNGSYQDFSDNTNFGKDIANSHTWIDVAMGTDHQYLDTPTNNLCIMNDNDDYLDGITNLIEGGLYCNRSGGTGNYSIRGTHAVSGGKWYFEAEMKLLGGSGTACAIGMIDSETELVAALHSASNAYCGMFSTGTWLWYENGSSYSLTGISGLVSGTTIMNVAFDLDAGKMWIGKDGTWYNSGNPATGANATSTIVPTDGRLMVPFATPYNSSGTDIFLPEFNFGQKAFSSTVPSGFKQISSINLPLPDILKPNKYYGQLAWAGDGNDDRSITGLEFQPDLVWWKVRASTNWHRIVDSVRGSSLGVYPNETDVEATDANECQAFESGGIQIGTDAAVNASGQNFTAWCWKEGVTPGLDIITYTGDGTSGRTVAHNLGVKPAFIWLKGRDVAGGHNIYHKSLGATKYLAAHVNTGASTSTQAWNDTEPGVSSIVLGNFNGFNQDTKLFVMYAFAEIEGFSKFGTYGGNGSTNGPVIHCGFKPAIIIIKRIDTTGTWSLYDNYLEPINDGTQQEEIYIDVNQANVSTMGIDIFANGFKLLDADAWKNNASGTYVFAAFAEQPFKYGRGV